MHTCGYMIDFAHWVQYMMLHISMCTYKNKNLIYHAGISVFIIQVCILKPVLIDTSFFVANINIYCKNIAKFFFNILCICIETASFILYSTLCKKIYTHIISLFYKSHKCSDVNGFLVINRLQRYSSNIQYI